MDSTEIKGPSISRALSVFGENLQYADLPVSVRGLAVHHILDVVGNALAATHFDFAHRALSALSALGEQGNSTLLGFASRLPLKDAVLVNGILAHGLDYDDSHPGGPVHPSASAFPCVFGVGEHYDRSGKELITAYLLGVELATRFGIAANGATHKAGFHTTGIAGHMGCALAAGKLLNLNATQLTWSQGLAGSTASAIGEFRADGAWSKRMHAGWAAVGGLTSALLARSGFVGTESVYEGVDGVFRSFAGAHFGQVDMSAMTSDLGSVWRASEVSIKPFPICHILHACVDSALALKRQYGLQPDDIAQARALLHPETFNRVCERPEIRKRPATEYVAKFSVYYTIAAAIVHGKCGFAELEPDALNDPRTLALADRVTYGADKQSRFPDYFSGGVELTLNDGRTLTHHEPIHRGAGDRALSSEEIEAKFLENAQLVVSHGRAEQLCEAVLGLEAGSVRDCARVFRLK